ncbi:class E sortase, partial [Streptomyces sp. SID9124]|nr:class E sortase [Streptomyces sp. SID9124]
MTPPRHGAGAGQDDPHDPRSYEDPGAFEAAVHGLSDPLNDPLPGTGPVPPPRQAPYDPQGPQQAAPEWYDPEGYQRDWYGPQSPVQPSSADPYSPADVAVEPATEVLGRIDADDPAVPVPRPEPEEAGEPGAAPAAAAPL